jgi:hypothetical protein
VTRTVKVKLTADHADLKTKLKEAGNAAKDMGATTAAAAKVATTALKGAEDAAEGLADALDDAADQGGGLTGLAADIRKLDNEIAKAENSARDLAREFARTGDDAVLTKLKAQRRELSQMRNVRKLLPAPVEMAAAGAQMAVEVGGGMARELPKFLSKGLPFAAVGAGMAAALVPFLSAAISAGVLGAAGGGGIVGGLALAARDQRVVDAAKLVGDRMMGQLSGASGSMVDAALDALDEIEEAVAALDGDIAGILDASAVNMEPLVGGAIGFIKELIPDLRTAIEQARPIFDSLQKIGPQLGDMLGDVLVQMAENAPTAAMALEQLVNIVDGGVRTLSDVISIATEAYQAAAQFGLMGPQAGLRAWRDELAAAPQGIRTVTKVNGELVTELNRTGQAAKEAATDLRTLHDIANEMTNANLTARESQVALRKAIKGATDAREEGAKITDDERSALYGLARAANTSTEALDAQGRTADQAARSHQKQRNALMAAAEGMGYSRKEARRLADSLLNIPSDVTPNIKVEGASAAQARIQAIKDALNRLPGTKTITINTRAEIPAGMSVRQLMEARGGTVTPMAAGGIYPASNPPIIKFAEPETGGELFVPRKGISRARARGLLAEGAAWHGLSVSPMAAGGSLVAAAQGSLVNVGSGGGSLSGTRLDYVESAISARDAVASLTGALKENGKAFGWSTAKGRDNSKALISGTRAAQQAAEAKYEETGSVAAANKVYADYIRLLDQSMKKMGINAATRRALLKAYSERPQYGVAPSNSSARVRSVTDQIGAEQALGDARAAFAWTKPTFNTKTATGQAELRTLFSFLGAAESAAQSLYTETGNSKTATTLYNTYLNGLRSTLRASGMSQGAIDNLFKTYGRITLTKNRWGGVYERAAGGLTEAQIAPGGPTRYAWAESSTGGEAFIPRNGDRARSLGIWQHVGEKWLGQSPTGGGRSGPVTVQATIPITLGAETITRQVRIEVDTALGQVVDAVVYQTA